MSYIIPVWNLPSLPIVGRGERFPVRHVYCVGPNYAEHAKEMGGDATKEPPFFFTKPADAVVPVVEPVLTTEKITFEPSVKSTGGLLMLVTAVPASRRLVSREIRFEPSRESLVTTCSSSSA